MSRLIENYIRNLFEEKQVSPENREQLWKYYYHKLAEAVDVGFSPKSAFYDKDLAQALKFSIAEFSAFKETSFRKDLEKLLTQDGKLTPWKDFKEKAYKISGDYNHRWLKTEYHQTVTNANMAEKWKEFEANKDLYPNLKLVSVRDSRVRPEHKIFDGTIRPIDDPFWNTHTPPLDWGCRCDIIQTDEEPTDIKGGLQLKIEFENNPATSGKIFGGTAYEKRLDKEEKVEASKWAERYYNHQQLKEPRANQFKTIFETEKGSVKQHFLAKQGDDYPDILKTAKAFAKQGKNVEIMPEINIKEKHIRDIIFPNLQSKTSNPDLKIGNEYFDVKRPSAIKNIVGNANKANKQGAVAIISDSKLDKELTSPILNERVKDIFKNDNYTKNQVYFMIKGKLSVFNRTGDK